MKISDLRMKDVIEADDGRRLGYISDIEIEPDAGRIEALIVPGTRNWRWFFSRNDDVILPWQRIMKLGIDVIIVQKESYPEKNAVPYKKRRTLEDEFDFLDV